MGGEVAQMKMIAVLVFLMMAVAPMAVAHITEEEITEVKAILEAKTACSALSDEQLELMGEYFMEQMHPGELHELMHERMGLVEGTEEEEQFHINMAKNWYCGDGTGMMGRGMMFNTKIGDTSQGGNMMYGSGYEI